MFRSKKILAEAQHHPCQYCGADDGTIVAAHSNQARHGKGMGIKAHDCFVAFLCAVCHAFVDFGQGTKDEKASVWGQAHDKTLPLIDHLLTPEARMLLRARFGLR